MGERLIVLLTLLTLCPPREVDGVRVLQFANGFSKSLILFQHRLAETVASEGHNVTLWRWRDYSLTMAPPSNVQDFDVPFNFTQELMVAWRRIAFSPNQMRQMIRIIAQFQGLLRDSTDMQLQRAEDDFEWLAGQRFDLVLAHPMDMTPLFVGDMLGLTGRVVTVMAGTYLIDSIVYVKGLPFPASVVPNYSSAFSDRMSFLERVQNWATSVMILASQFGPTSPLWVYEAAYRAPPNVDRRGALHAYSQLRSIFVNGEQFLDFPRPISHDVFYLSEMGNADQATTEAQLDEQWTRLVDEAQSGVIAFSFGTIASVHDMPREMALALLEGLAQFTDYTIVWRFDAELPEAKKYSHIHLVNWLPQRDLLRHPKTKLFVTHAGYNSLLESAKAGVPMVLIPLFVDQYGNAVRAVRFGLGVKLDKTDITADSFAAAIRSVLGDPSFAARASKMARTFDDKIISPEAALSHRIKILAKKDTWFPTLKAAQRLSFIQYHCLDVLLLFSVCASAVLYVFVRVSRAVIRKIFSKR